MGEFFNTILVYPLTNMLLAVYSILSFVNLPFALGFSIIGLTVVIRLVLYPFTTAQIKASHKMQKVSPLISEIKQKYKGDNARIQKETLSLYKEQGINPAAGCLPLLLQMPIIIALYSMLQLIVNFKESSILAEVNKIAYFDFLKLERAWDPNFFGVSLGGVPSNLLSTLGPVVFLVPVVTGILQFIFSKMMIPEKKEVGKEIQKKSNVDKKDAGDFASAFQTQSVYIFPVMIGFFSFSFPIGLSLYWNTFTLFGIIQQYRVAGLGGLSKWIKKK
jgi:YidC/Oxa1 family membrane protein insertase